MSTSQGAKANFEGFENRADIRSILLRHGWEQNPLPFVGADAVVELIKRLETPRLVESPAGVFACEVNLGQTVYCTEMREDFLLYRAGWAKPLALAARHQKSSGSARDKLEYLFANINERFPCPCMVVLEGAELEPVRRRAREWVQRSGGRLAAVFDGVQDFRRWITDGCAYPSHPSTLGI